MQKQKPIRNCNIVANQWNRSVETRDAKKRKIDRAILRCGIRCDRGRPKTRERLKEREVGGKFTHIECCQMFFFTSPATQIPLVCTLGVRTRTQHIHRYTFTPQMLLRTDART